MDSDESSVRKPTDRRGLATVYGDVNCAPSRPRKKRPLNNQRSSTGQAGEPAGVLRHYLAKPAHSRRAHGVSHEQSPDYRGRMRCSSPRLLSPRRRLPPARHRRRIS